MDKIDGEYETLKDVPKIVRDEMADKVIKGVYLFKSQMDRAMPRLKNTRKAYVVDHDADQTYWVLFST
jgi:hypothetical protein